MNEKESILIVDDDENTRTTLTLILGEQGFEIATAGEGKEAVEKARERFFNLALLDIGLPDIEGVDLIAPLKEMHPDMAVIIATGRASVENAARALNEGAAAYVTKPLDIGAVLAKVRDALEKQRLQLENKRLLEMVQREEEELRRRNRELELLNRLITASASDLEPEAILETACRELARAFDVPQAAAALLNEGRTEAVVVAEYLSPELRRTQSSRSEHRLAESQLPALNETIPVAGNPAFQYLLTHKAPLAVNDAQHDPCLTPVHDLMRQRGTVSLLILPLVIEGQVVGSLSLDAIASRHFSAEEINLAWSVADQVARRLARARLAQTQQRLSAAIEQIAEGVIITDAEGTILYVNPAFEQITGYSRAEAIGQNPRILKSGKQDAAFYEELWETITAGEVWQGCFINKKKDGTIYTEDATITPLGNGNGGITHYVAIKRDVTRELQLEEQYRQAQKMEAIGRLAGGVAHDFNNLLTAIGGYVHLLLQDTPPDDPRYHDLAQIQKTSDRAEALVRQLLTFSRREAARPVVLDLNGVITDLFKLLSRVITEDVKLTASLAPDLAPVYADPGQMEQVLMNLAVNASDAMPEGGQLVIETSNVTLDQCYTDAHVEIEPGEYVSLTVSDTGAGMDDEVLSHIFEPFFTTKPAGEGTGLGLATVYGIVGQHDGHIHVYSEPGRGTTFRIYFPVYRPDPEAGPEERAEHEAPEAAPLTGDETLLVAEDDTPVCELIQVALEGYGYTVLAAPNGQQAMNLFQAHRDEVALLISDVVMPDTTGPALYQVLAEEAPHLKVLFLSGHPGQVVRGRGVLQDAPFLPKPFTLTDLARKVRQVLDD